MNNVQHLLDSYGPPPSEVCLDWAYQLLRLAQESHSSTSASWTSLQVNKNGQLSLSTDRTSHEQSVAVLVQQLLEWSKRGVNSEATHQSISMNDATKSEIHQELLQMMRELQAPLSPRNSIDTQKVNVVDAADLTANQLDSPRLLSAAQTASPTGSPSTTSRKAKSKQLSRTMIFGVASLLAVVSTIAFFLWPRSSQIENRLASQAPLPSIADHAQVELAGSPNEELAILAGTPEDHSSLLSPQETTQSSIGLSLSGPIGGLSSVQSNPSSASNQPQEPSDSLNPADTKNTAPTETALSSVPELPSVPALSENPSSDQSVESMLAEAAKAEPKINNLDTEVNASGIPKLQPGSESGSHCGNCASQQRTSLRSIRQRCKVFRKSRQSAGRSTPKNLSFKRAKSRPR